MKDLFDHSLARGADAHWSRDLDGWSGLHSAARFNNGDLLELLLAQTGVDVNIRDNRNTTPLMFACISGHENIVRRLCQVTDIQLNSTRKDDGRTALHCAVIYNKTAACASVMRGVAGVDWNVRDNAGNSPLTEAVELGRTDILQTILSVPEPHLDLSVTDSKGRNIAQIAVEHNRQRQRCVELLSGDKRVDRYWNIKNSDGDTPVMYCLKNNKTEIARSLINTPVVDLDTVDSDGRHLEEIAREGNMTDILNLLWTFRSVQQRMVLRDSLLSRQAKRFSSLPSLSRDAVLLILSTNNTQERLVTPLVDRLEGEITRQVREQLLASYSERN